jgi:hypothetical protein
MAIEGPAIMMVKAGLAIKPVARFGKAPSVAGEQINNYHLMGYKNRPGEFLGGFLHITKFNLTFLRKLFDQLTP